ncbi:hypothetical protein GCM10022254_28710 [Actinomadura meridiana]|uniref:DUF3592 domain-containing protein n=1 Tax=Actinomadura meridiana TaxID=559626 RepID=A0ABP8C0D8_9ACTN
MDSKSGWFGPTLRPLRSEAGAHQLVVHYVWPFGAKNGRREREEYLPSVTLNGESVAAEWGTTLYVLREPAYTMRAVQGREIVRPVPAGQSGTVMSPETTELTYRPGSTGFGNGVKTDAKPPRLHATRRHRWNLLDPLIMIYGWIIAYVLVLGLPVIMLLGKA